MSTDVYGSYLATINDLSLTQRTLEREIYRLRVELDPLKLKLHPTQRERSCRQGLFCQLGSLNDALGHVKRRIAELESKVNK